MTAREAKAWRTAMHAHGVDIGALESTLDAACRQPGIPSDEIGLAEIALQHSADMFTAEKLSLAIAYGREASARVDSLRKELDLIPELMRDRARQAGPRKPRGSKMPLLDKWLSRQLRKGDVTNNALWDALPSPDYADDLYRDGNSVVETDRNGKQHSVTREGFDKRVTAARKASAANT